MSHFVINNAENDITEATVYGIPYNYDDRTGTWNVWNISSFIVGANLMTNQDGKFYDRRNFKSENISIVWVKQVLTINPEIYKFNFLSKSSFRVTRELCEPGRTSINYVTALVDTQSGNILAKQYVKFAGVNNETRAVVRLPEWYLSKYSYLQSKGIPVELSRKTIPVPPKSCYEHKAVVRFSDQDSNFHMGQSVYTKLCFDCATEASINGKLVHFTGDITWYPVLYLSNDFIGECFPGDKLTIVLWQDDKDVSKLHFQIYKDEDRKQLTYVECRLGMEPMKLNKSSSKL